MSGSHDLLFLMVGIAVDLGPMPGIDFHRVASAREAIAMIRILDFHLLLSGRHIPDQSIWSLIRNVRALRPKQRWVLIAEGVTPQEEIDARAMGALAVLDPTGAGLVLGQLAGSLQRSLARRPATAAGYARSLIEAT